MDIDVHNLSVIVSTNIYLKNKKQKQRHPVLNKVEYIFLIRKDLLELSI